MKKGDPEENKLTQFVGFLVPKTIDNCLWLQCALQGSSKGAVVRTVLEKYMEENNWTEESLLVRYAQYTHSIWYLRYRDAKTFEKYLETVRGKLAKQYKFPEPLIDTIITTCNEMYPGANQSEKK